jgi:hypothetical protein
MLHIRSNIGIIITNKIEIINALQGNVDPILRTVAMAVLPELKKRVHIDGKDSNDQLIGNYSPSYMVVRTGNYKNAAKYKRGEKAGQFKERKKTGEAGTFTKGVNTKFYHSIVEETTKVGTNRPTYNRTADTKSILSLTKQMENDLTIIDTASGYGIGYLNPENYKKAIWCEENYKKKILTKLTKEEKEIAKKTAIEFTPNYIKNL